MKLLIAGSRKITSSTLLYEVMLETGIKANDIDVIISGGAKGVDSLAEGYAFGEDIPFQVYPADWEQFGKAAGPIRNRLMADVCDQAVILWDGESSGTLNMIEQLIEKGKPYFLVVHKVVGWK